MCNEMPPMGRDRALGMSGEGGVEWCVSVLIGVGIGAECWPELHFH